MNLTEVPETVTWPKTHYVFVEKVGPSKPMLPRPGRASINSLPGLRNTIRSRDT